MKDRWRDGWTVIRAGPETAFSGLLSVTHGPKAVLRVLESRTSTADSPGEEILEHEGPSSGLPPHPAAPIEEPSLELHGRLARCQGLPQNGGEPPGNPLRASPGFVNGQNKANRPCGCHGRCSPRIHRLSSSHSPVLPPDPRFGIAGQVRYFQVGDRPSVPQSDDVALRTRSLRLPRTSSGHCCRCGTREYAAAGGPHGRQRWRAR